MDIRLKFCLSEFIMLKKIKGPEQWMIPVFHIFMFMTPKKLISMISGQNHP